MCTKSWQLFNPVHVRFGVGVRDELATMLAAKNILIVSTARSRRQFEQDKTLAPIAANCTITWTDKVRPNPSLVNLQAEIDVLLGQPFQAIVAFGGGSAIDSAKALAAALGQEQQSCNLARMISQPDTYIGPHTIPIYALPTTSGTGSEVTPFATIWDDVNVKKLSLVSQHLFPKVAFIDPELTYSTPRSISLSTGLDALNQAFESLWNHNRNPVSQLIAGRAIGLALDALPVLASGLCDVDSRIKISEASFLAGLCISQSRTAICHSISYPLTAHFNLPHGYACAFSMYAVAQFIATKAPNILNSVAVIAGLRDGLAILAELKDVLTACDVKVAITEHIPNVDAVVALQSEMFTPGRADNFIFEMDHHQLRTILHESSLSYF